jgi:hypothetical protein
MSLLANASQDEYEVQDILDVRWKDGQREFLIRWKKYTLEHDSWEVSACM